MNRQAVFGECLENTGSHSFDAQAAVEREQPDKNIVLAHLQKEAEVGAFYVCSLCAAGL